jgi:STE24 endopeptidase
MFVAVGVLLVLFLVLLLPFRRAALRRIDRIEHDVSPVAERVHRLQRGSLVTTFGGLAVGVVIEALVFAGQPHHPRGTHGHASPSVLLIFPTLLVMLAPALLTAPATRAAVGRLRDADLSRRAQPRKIALLVGYALLIGSLVGVVGAVLPEHGILARLARVVVLGVCVVGAQMLAAPLILLAVKARPLPPECRARFERLAEQARVEVRGFRVLAARRQRQANAFQLGGIPGLRYIAVTDYLLDNLPDDQIDAIVAHELGHVAGHHLLKKSAAWLAAWAALQALVSVVASIADSPALTATVPLLLVVALVLVQGAIGVRLERRADEAAVELVGARATAEALERMGELNHTQRRTSRGWDLLTQHPGLEARIGLARERDTTPYPDAPTAVTDRAETSAVTFEGRR